jgi:DNA-binding GntR family transcriptional regulator
MTYRPSLDRPRCVTAAGAIASDHVLAPRVGVIASDVYLTCSRSHAIILVYRIRYTEKELILIPPRGRLSQLPDLEDTIKLDRTLLKDQAAEILRDHISSGRIPEGTRLTEREVSHMLGISRMPAREALMILEAEGLVERRNDERRVVELTEQRVRDLHVVRRTLEKLAAELAAANTNEENRAVLFAKFHELEEAVATGDLTLCTKRDLAIHQAIWHQANNTYLLKVLDSMLGVIFVLAARVKLYGTGVTDRLLRQHRELVELIGSGNAEGVSGALDAQLRLALTNSLNSFRIQDRVDASEP